MNRSAQFKFRLYVAGDGLNSARALASLENLCQKHLPDRHEIEVVDVYVQPERALVDGIFMTPMLVKLAPLPVKRIVGTLNDIHIVLQALGLGSSPEA